MYEHAVYGNFGVHEMFKAYALGRAWPVQRYDGFFAIAFDGDETPGAVYLVCAWRIPGTGEPGGLPSMGSHRVGHD